MRKTVTAALVAALAGASVAPLAYAQTITRSGAVSGSVSGQVTTRTAPSTTTTMPSTTMPSTTTPGASTTTAPTPGSSITGNSTSPGASGFAPGQEATSTAPARTFAPGHVKKRRKLRSARSVAPGQQMRNATAPTGASMSATGRMVTNSTVGSSTNTTAGMATNSTAGATNSTSPR